jgi:hypothetical protein
MITKYAGTGVGYGGAPPALDKLSAPQVWKARKARASRGMRKIALNLIKLQVPDARRALRCPFRARGAWSSSWLLTCTTQAERMHNTRAGFPEPERRAEFEAGFPHAPTPDQVCLIPCLEGQTVAAHPRFGDTPADSSGSTEPRPGPCRRQRSRQCAQTCATVRCVALSWGLCDQARV